MSDEFWSELRSDWRAIGHGPTADQARAQVRRANRRLAMARTSIVLVAIAGIAAALSHAANTLEALLGLGAGVALALAWVAAVIADRRTDAIIAETGERYAAARASILQAQLRVVRFVWIVLGTLLVFLVPWWIGGFAAHGDGMLSAIGLYAFWLPAAGIVALLRWTIARARSAGREVAALKDPA